MNKALKILMLEDVPEDATLVEKELKKAGIDTICCRTDRKEDFVRTLQTFEPDIILSDYSLPQFNALEAFQLSRSHNANVPFILVTDQAGEEFAAHCLNEGAHDYILKSHLRRLPAVIMNILKQRELEDQRKNAEASLRSQNEELIKINQELDRFVYSASHDLRAPLKSVLGLVKLIQMDCKRQQYECINEYMNLIEQSIGKLDHTIKDIIDYSKNTRMEVYKEDVDLGALVNDVFEHLRYIDGSDNVEKEVKMDESFPFVSDENRIRVILNNIVSNAIKYRDPSKERSKIMIRMNICKEKAKIHIQDNGIGIKRQYMDKIFDMFYRATEKSEGSGLGLYIVKETLEKLRGTVIVNSEYTKGTSFIIEIPNLYKEKAK